MFRSKWFFFLIFFFFFFFLILLTIFLREGRWVCRACATAKWQCTLAGGDTIKVSWKTEDVEEGSSGRNKWKRKEDKEIEVEFGLVVEELWG